jgi:hypothetical protein
MKIAPDNFKLGDYRFLVGLDKGQLMCFNFTVAAEVWLPS